MTNTITKLQFFTTNNPEIKAELDSLIAIAERTQERLNLFERYHSGELNDVEYLEQIKEIKIRKQLDEFPM